MGRIPEEYALNKDQVIRQIDELTHEFCVRYEINMNSISDIRTIPHNLINSLLFNIYNTLFKPDIKLIHQQNSLIDYTDIDLLVVIANKFIEICLLFNKSLGLMSFSTMTGIDLTTMIRWLNDRKSNPIHYKLLKNIQDMHKMEHISLLNDTPVGALAVANNDVETGLEWNKNQVQQITNNTVYMIPSERVDHLRLEEPETPQELIASDKTSGD